MTADIAAALSEAAVKVFSTMLQLPAECGAPEQGIPLWLGQPEVSGVVGLSGGLTGWVALRFSEQTAARFASAFVGRELAAESTECADAIGELAEMICGCAIAALSERSDVQVSCPSVVAGRGQKLRPLPGVIGLVIPCRTECGDLCIEASLHSNAPGRVELQGAAGNA